MAIRSEFEIWRDEIEPPPRLTITERVAKWFDRPKQDEAETDHFVWKDVGELFR
jgi:hypothetical protein